MLGGRLISLGDSDFEYQVGKLRSKVGREKPPPRPLPLPPAA